MEAIKAKLGDLTFDIDGELKVSGKLIEKIVVREPVVRDLKMVSHISDDYERGVTLVANLTSMSVQEVEELPAHLYMKIQNKVETFLG